MPFGIRIRKPIRLIATRTGNTLHVREIIRSSGIAVDKFTQAYGHRSFLTCLGGDGSVRICVIVPIYLPIGFSRESGVGMLVEDTIRWLLKGLTRVADN